MSEFKLIYGVGFNDRKYKSSLNGKVIYEYRLWIDLLRRCYSEKLQNKYPTYKGKFVCEEWLNFSNFYEWVKSCPFRQDGWDLDKDLLFKGNECYGPETCVFLPHRLNTFLTKLKSVRGELPVGVCYIPESGTYRALCSIGGGIQKSKVFKTCSEAFEWYKQQKENLAKELASLYKEAIDPRAYEALMNFKVDIED